MTRPDGGGQAPERAALEVHGLGVPFGVDPGLKDLSFSVEGGERFVLVGASGAGKTSLLKAISGSGPISRGRVWVDGKDVTNLPPEGRGMIFLPQRPLLFPHMSVFENVAFPLRVRGVPIGELALRVREALGAVRLGAYENRRPKNLSGGQAHRVALARAVVSRPPVLLLDEPLTSLDPSLRDEVRQSILTVHQEYGPALLLVTHDLQEAGRMADRVGVLLDGGLGQVSTPEVLFRSPSTVQVARFLGLANELPGVLKADGRVWVEGWDGPLVGPQGVTSFSGFEAGPLHPSSADGGGRGQDRGVVLLFGGDAGRILPGGVGGLPALVTEIHHHPEGAKARIVPAVAQTRPSEGDRPISVEVAQDTGCLARVGDRVQVAFLPERIHIFPEPDS